MKVTKAWVFQVCFGKHIADRDCRHTITKTLWPSDPANTCENKQVSVTKKKNQPHTTSDSLALILEFKNVFSSLRIKFLFHWSQQTPFDFDKATISFEVFCFLLICICVWRFILSSKPFLRVTWNRPSFPAVWAPHWLEDNSQTDKECLPHDR